MKILIIGSGNMGMTYYQSFLRSKIIEENQLFVLCSSELRIKEKFAKNPGTFFSSAENCVPMADIIILAVKPQDAPTLLKQIQPFVKDSMLVLSVMAGITMERIQHTIGIEKIIRAMPNLPTQLGAGATSFTASDKVSTKELLIIQNLLNTTGKTLYLENEQMLNASTAISGSGPAYVFYFMNSLIESAKEMGFTNSEAELLVSQTFSGAIDLYKKGDNTCMEWIDKVASKGGTTEAALEIFDASRLQEIISIGAQAALRRSKELGS